MTIATDKDGNVYKVQYINNQKFDNQHYYNEKEMFKLLQIKGISVKFVLSLIQILGTNNIIQSNISDMAKMCNVSLNTAKSSMKILVDKVYIRKYNSNMYQLNPALRFDSNSSRRREAYLMFMGNTNGFNG